MNMLTFENASAEEVHSLIRDRILHIAAVNSPATFRAWFCSAIITNVVGNLSDNYWQQMRICKPCKELGCDCHLIADKFMKALEIVREDFRTHAFKKTLAE